MKRTGFIPVLFLSILVSIENYFLALLTTLKNNFTKYAINPKFT